MPKPLSYEEWVRAGSPTAKEEVRGVIREKRREELLKGREERKGELLREREKRRALREGEERREFRKKETQQVFEDISETPGYIGARAGKLADRLGVGLLKGAALVSKLKGIRHPDSLVHNRDLYGVGKDINPAFTPTGKILEDPMDLYLIKRKKGIPEGTQAIYSSLQQGYNIEQLEVITGLQPGQILRGIQYLKKKGLWRPEFEA